MASKTVSSQLVVSASVLLCMREQSTTNPVGSVENATREHVGTMYLHAPQEKNQDPSPSQSPSPREPKQSKTSWQTTMKAKPIVKEALPSSSIW